MEDSLWTDGIELALNDIRIKSLNKSDKHKKKYFFFKSYLKYFRVPTIILSGMNSVFSVGLQPYISQGIISILCCSISLICGIIASIELFLGIQNMMEKEIAASKEFYVLSRDIFKTLSVEREYRMLNGKIYLDNVNTKYCNLIEQSNLLGIEQNIKPIINEVSKEQIGKLIKDKIGIENIKISDIKVSKEECKEQTGKLLEDNVSIELGFQEKDFDNMLNQESESIASVNDAINNKDNCDNV